MYPSVAVTTPREYNATKIPIAFIYFKMIVPSLEVKAGRIGKF